MTNISYAYIGGALYGAVGGVWMFTVGACISSVSLALAMGACRQWPEHRSLEATQEGGADEEGGTGEVARLLAPRDDE